MVGEREKVQNTVGGRERERHRLRQGEREEKGKEGKRVLGSALEEGNIRLLSVLYISIRCYQEQIQTE